MSYLLDTNVISEPSKKKPDSRVISWFDRTPPEKLFVSVLSLGEIRRGIERHPDRKRRLRLRAWFDHDLLEWFEGRVLPVDVGVADTWGRLLAEAGRPLPSIDSLIAATALHHNLTLVTRNIRDFDYHGLQVLDPWS